MNVIAIYSQCNCPSIYLFIFIEDVVVVFVCDLVSIAFDSLTTSGTVLVVRVAVDARRVLERPATRAALRVLVLDHRDLFHVLARRYVHFRSSWKYRFQFLDRVLVERVVFGKFNIELDVKIALLVRITIDGHALFGYASNRAGREHFAWRL